MTASWLAARARAALGVCVLLIVLAPPAARAGEQCARIADPVARLACYDAANPVQGPAATNPSPVPASSIGTPVHAPSVPSAAMDPAAQQPAPHARAAANAPTAARHVEPEAAAERPPDAVVSATASRAAPASPAAPESTAARDARDRFGLPPANPLTAADDLDQLESIVVAVRKQARQNTAYRLANGQIWMQTTPREVTIDEGDHVTIRRGLLGGYVLRNRDGASTRVGRIH